jgi:hypothetical protein
MRLCGGVNHEYALPHFNLLLPYFEWGKEARFVVSGLDNPSPTLGGRGDNSSKYPFFFSMIMSIYHLLPNLTTMTKRNIHMV